MFHLEDHEHMKSQNLGHLVVLTLHYELSLQTPWPVIHVQDIVVFFF